MADFTVREATVLSVAGDGLLVRVDDEDAADHSGCRSCAMKSLCRGRDDGHLELFVSRSGGEGEYLAGDRVRVAYRGANPAVASLIMFLPALAGVMFGGFVANAAFGGGDGVFLAGALGGAALGVGATFVLSRSLSSLRPEIRLAAKGDEFPESWAADA